MEYKTVLRAFSYKKAMQVGPYFYSLLVLLFLFSACEKEETIHLDGDLEQYFDRFAIEASLHNITFDYQADRVEGYLSELEESGISGKCVRNSVYPNRVYIDLDFWRQASDLEKEFVVFHELGHCFLDRGHLDDANTIGVCVSMMHSGEGDCRNMYSRTTRAAYLAELFTY